MMELDLCKALWRDQPASSPATLIRKEELKTMLHAMTSDIRARALERVSKEGYTYVGIVVAITAINLTDHGVTFKAFASSFAVMALLGVVIAALAYQQHQLRTLPLSGSLKESLVALIARLDSASRVYMAAYMACIVISIAMVEGLLFWRDGLTWLTLLSLAAAAAIVAWCYHSGRAYLQRMFGYYKMELTDCQRELEAA